MHVEAEPGGEKNTTDIKKSLKGLSYALTNSRLASMYPNINGKENGLFNIMARCP